MKESWHDKKRGIGRCRLCGDISKWILPRTDFLCGGCLWWKEGKKQLDEKTKKEYEAKINKEKNK